MLIYQQELKNILKIYIQEHTDISIENKAEIIQNFVIDINKDLKQGDLYTNLALLMKNNNSINNAFEIKKYIDSLNLDFIETIICAGVFVNFFLKIKITNMANLSFPKNNKRIMFDYTDPNPMKVFHIGHLMSNVIGESFTRLFEYTGHEVYRVSYQGDVGRHIAVTLYGFLKSQKNWPTSMTHTLTEKVQFLGQCYVYGNNIIKDNENDIEKSFKIKEEIDSINKLIYNKQDQNINKLYDEGKAWSLEKFEELYALLGTKFNHYFFESESAPIGINIIKNNINIFENGDGGSVIFKGEDYNLHTRVFINSNGLSTYEGKEIGLIDMKNKLWPFDKSFVITANEQNEVFKVTKKVAELIFKDLENKIFHIGHGMMRLIGQKISSRLGNTPEGDVLIYSIADEIKLKMQNKNISDMEKVASDIAVSAIKFTILKQNIKKDIIFDIEKSISTEGDSGPYILYSLVRIKSILKKCETINIDFKNLEDFKNDYDAIFDKNIKNTSYINLYRTLYRFDIFVQKAFDEMALQYIAQYALDLTSKFNSFYLENKIISDNDIVDKDNLALIIHTKKTLENALNILGIKTVEKM